MSKNKKKLGYSQYEAVLSDHNYKLEILAQRYSELQSYFLGFLEFTGKSLEFHEWMKARIEEMKKEVEENETKEKSTLHDYQSVGDEVI